MLKWWLNRSLRRALIFKKAEGTFKTYPEVRATGCTSEDAKIDQIGAHAVSKFRIPIEIFYGKQIAVDMLRLHKMGDPRNSCEK